MKARRYFHLLSVFLFLVPAIPGCATVTAIVTGPIFMPVSWLRRSMQPRSLPIDLVRAPLCLLVVPFGPLNGFLGAEIDLEYLKHGSYHAVLEKRENADGTVLVRRGLPFTAVLDPCAYLMRREWEPEECLPEP